MRNENRRVVIVGGLRTPFVKSFGKYKSATNLDMLTFLLKDLVQKYSLQNKILGDVALGAVLKHAKDFNLAREAVLGSGLDSRTPAYDLQRACGTSLEACGQIAAKISTGQIEVGIAGGSDTNSDMPVTFSKDFVSKFLKISQSKSMKEKLAAIASLRPKDLKPVIPNVSEPRTGLSMGEHAELMAKNWEISREEQDQLAFSSQKNANQAYENGFYDDIVSTFQNVKKDQFIREDSSLEGLAKLRPAFDKENGSLTAGNSTPLTDGAAVCLLASEDYAKEHNLPILAYFIDIQVAAVDFVQDEGLLMAPTHAVASLLKRNQLKLQDFDFYEIHEAFAAQALANMKAWESEDYCKKRLGLDSALGSIPRERLNVKGGSVALGHPFAATGARLVGSMSKLLSEEKKDNAIGIMSACTAGGMGVAAILKKA